MELLALDLPGLDGQPTNIPNPPGLRFSGAEKTSLGYIVSEFLTVIFVIAGFLMFLYFLWGVFRYIMAEGKKDELAKAKNHMRWAIVGFILFMLAFFIGPFVRSLFPQVGRFYQNNYITPLERSTNPLPPNEGS
jgi:hypothetical protein